MAESGKNIKFIAEKAGVSTATVSRVLHGKGNVRSEVAERVLAVAEQFDYRAVPRNSSAQSPVVLIIPTVSTQHYADLTSGVFDEAFSAGRTLCILPCRRPEEEETVLRTAYSLNPSGIIYKSMSGKSPQSLVPALKGIPLVILGSESVDEEVPHIWRDIEPDAYTATRYLLKLGHRRIVFGNYSYTSDTDGYETFMEKLNGPDSRDFSYCSQYRGYCRALEEYGISPDRELMIGSGYRFESGHSAALSLLTGVIDFDAMIVTNDLCAAGVLKALASQGCRVPDQVSLICLGGGTLASAVSPTLTCIKNDGYGMGKCCVRTLLKIEQHQPVSDIRYSNPLFTIGESTRSRV